MSNKREWLAVVISFLGSSFLLCMDQSGPELYRVACDRINTIQEQKLTRDITSVCQGNPLGYIPILEAKFSFYKSKLIGQKEAAFKAIQDKHNISQETWLLCRDTIERLKQFNEMNKNSALIKVTHDKSIYPDILLMIKKELLNNSVNPEGVSLLTASEDGVVMEVTPPSLHYSLIDGIVVLNTEKIIPGVVMIQVDSFQKLPFVCREALYIRMVELLMDSSALDIYVIGAFTPLFKINCSDLMNCPSVRALKSLYTEKLSLMLPALKSKRNARKIRQYAYFSHDVKFTQEDYNFLSRVERHWKVLKWIEKHCSAPVPRLLSVRQSQPKSRGSSPRRENSPRKENNSQRKDS